ARTLAAEAGGHDHRRDRHPAGRLAGPRAPGRGRRVRRLRRPGHLRPRGARDLPVGAARGDHPGPLRQDERAGRAVTDRPLFALSTASVYPESVAHGFEYAARLGYDAVEVMVSIDSISQDPAKVRKLRDYHEVPVCAVHAPCLLITQRVWGTDPWEK